MHHRPRGSFDPFRCRSCQRSLLGLALTLGLLDPTPATAQPESVPQTAQFHLDRGYDFFRNKQYDRAVQEFRAAQALKPSSINFFNEARAWEEADRPEDGLAALDRFWPAVEEEQRQDPQPILTQTMARARELQTKLEHHVYGGLILRCEPATAEVTLTGPTGVLRGACPWSNPRLNRGQYQVRIEAKGHAPLERQLEVRAGRTRAEELRLDPLPGHLSIRSTEADAQVLIDGLPMGRTPEVNLDLAAGTHQVEVLFAGGKSWNQQVRVAPGGQALVQAEPTGRGWGWWLAGGLAVAGAGAAVVTILLLSQEEAPATPEQLLEVDPVLLRAPARPAAP